MIVLNRRDRRVIRFIEFFGCASTTQLHKLFFGGVSLRRCQQRLALLTKHRKIQRDREHLSADFLYWCGKKPREITHMLMRVDFYISVNKRYTLASFVPEYSIGDLRADAYFEIYRNGMNVPYFLEVQRSPYLNQAKYERLFESGVWLDRWPHFPPVVVVSDTAMRFKDGNVRFISADQRL